MTAPVFVATELVGAAKMNSLPKGVLGYAQATANQTGITTEVDLTGLSVTVDVAASRRIKIVGQVMFSGGTGTCEFKIKESTTQLQQANTPSPSGNGETLQLVAIITPSSGSHTYKLTARSTVGTMQTIASATVAAFIIVEDIGGV